MTEEPTSTSRTNRPVLIVALSAIILAGIAAVWVSRAAKPNAAKTAAPAQLYLSPAKSTLAAGQTITIQVRTNSGSVPVNAIQANFSYPADKLSFVSSDDSASAYSVKAEAADMAGTIHIARGNITPLTGDQLVSSITFKAKPGHGSAALNFLPSSALVSSHNNTNILTATAGANFQFGK